MTNKILQLINDEIICYKKAINDVNEKLNLLSFLNGVDNYMGKSLNLNKNDLLSKKGELEGKLRTLIDRKSELTGKNEQEEDIKTIKNIQNSYLMVNYLSLNNFENNLNTEEDKNVNSGT